jgi:hypothetical protein
VGTIFTFSHYNQIHITMIAPKESLRADLAQSNLSVGKSFATKAKNGPTHITGALSHTRENYGGKFPSLAHIVKMSIS